MFDQIIASAYFVFETDLTHHIIERFIKLLAKSGIEFNRNDLKMKEISEVIEFKDFKYQLKDGYTKDDIACFINLQMVAIFSMMKQRRDEYYSGKTKREDSCIVKKIDLWRKR